MGLGLRREGRAVPSPHLPAAAPASTRAARRSTRPTAPPAPAAPALPSARLPQRPPPHPPVPPPPPALQVPVPPPAPPPSPLPRVLYGPYHCLQQRHKLPLSQPCRRLGSLIWASPHGQAVRSTRPLRACKGPCRSRPPGLPEPLLPSRPPLPPRAAQCALQLQPGSPPQSPRVLMRWPAAAGAAPQPLKCRPLCSADVACSSCSPSPGCLCAHPHLGAVSRPAQPLCLHMVCNRGTKPAGGALRTTVCSDAAQQQLLLLPPRPASAPGLLPPSVRRLRSSPGGPHGGAARHRGACVQGGVNKTES